MAGYEVEVLHPRFPTELIKLTEGRELPRLGWKLVFRCIEVL